MISLYCKECKKYWYTCNTKCYRFCDICGGELREDEEHLMKVIKNYAEALVSNNSIEINNDMSKKQR